MSDELPQGWTIAKLDDIVSFALGGDWGKDPDELADGMTRVRVVRGTEFKTWRKDKGASAAERCIKVSSLEKRRLEKDDLVLEVSGGGPHQPVGRTVLIPALLKRFRQAVFAAACSGRLTADWREENPNTSNAGDLISQVSQRRREKLEKLLATPAKARQPTLGDFDNVEPALRSDLDLPDMRNHA
jgi:hypothetical protein